MQIFKTLFAVLLWCVSIYNANAQFTNLSLAEYQQRYNEIKNQPADDGKLQIFRKFIAGRNLTSQQVRQLAALFTADAQRFVMAGEAYPSVRDKENFYDVYDAFVSFSAAFRLHDYVASLNTPDVLPANPPQNGPAITYPLCTNYNGKTGCALPISDNDFNVLAVNIFNQTTDEQRMKNARTLLASNCISMAQLMKIALSFNLETNRLAFMKESLLKIYDWDNYNYAAAVFTYEPYKNDWLAFAKTTTTPTIVVQPAIPVCEVTGAEMEEAKNAIKKESFSDTQLALAKQIISAKKCFTCAQVKQLAQLFSFDDAKLDLVKYAYDFTTDKSNYYTLNSVFSFSNSKDQLMKFIQSKK